MDKEQRHEFRQRLGKRIQALRKDRKIKRKEVAAALGCTVQNLRGIEIGAWGTDASNLPLLATLLGVTVNELITEDDNAATNL